MNKTDLISALWHTSLPVLPPRRYFIYSPGRYSIYLDVIDLIWNRYAFLFIEHPGHSDRKPSLSSSWPLYLLYLLHCIQHFHSWSAFCSVLRKQWRFPEPWTSSVETLSSLSKSGGYFFQPHAPFTLFQLPCGTSYYWIFLQKLIIVKLNTEMDLNWRPQQTWASVSGHTIPLNFLVLKFSLLIFLQIEDWKRSVQR